jgi:hypothetical protein
VRTLENEEARGSVAALDPRAKSETLDWKQIEEKYLHVPQAVQAQNAAPVARLRL